MSAACVCNCVADRVFDAESSTLQIYEAHTQDIIASAVQGFNGVFLLACAYSGLIYFNLISSMRDEPSYSSTSSWLGRAHLRNPDETVCSLDLAFLV